MKSTICRAPLDVGEVGERPEGRDLRRDSGS